MLPLLALTAAASSLSLRPLDEVIALDESALSPSSAVAAAFAINHSNAVYFQLATHTIRANACLDMCAEPCSSAAQAKCNAVQTVILPGVIDLYGEIASTATNTIKENRNVPCMPCMLKKWASSQLVADLHTLCTQIQTYANATRLLWQLGYTVNTNGGRLGILLGRHKNAKRILNIAAQLKARDFCNIYATSFTDN